jgi:phospholipid/cholesterol/gamma-HCH transport system substrate-binding protein
MKWLRSSLAVGVLALAALGVFYYLFTFVYKGAEADSYRLWAWMKDATDLSDKSRVVIAGVGVGAISKIELAMDESDPVMPVKAKVWIKIKNGTKVWPKAVLAKRAASVLGSFYLEIFPGRPEDGPELVDGDQIKNVLEITPYDTVLSEVQKIASNVREITDSFNAVFGGPEGRERIRRIVEGVDAAIEENSRLLTEVLTSTRRVLDNLEGFSGDLKGFSRSELAEILENVRVSTKEIRDFIGKVAPPTGETVAELRGTLDRINSAVEKADASLADIKTVTTTVAAGEGVAGKLLIDKPLGDSVEDTLDEAGALVKSISRLQMIVELRSEFYFRDLVSKNYLTLKVYPNADKYYLIELVDDPRGTTSIIERTVECAPCPAGKPPLHVERITETTEKLRLTFQFASRLPVPLLDFITIRFGIKESVGGIGLDMDFFNKRLEINTDLFDFSYAALPRLRIWAGFQPWFLFSKVYLVAGLDDILNNKYTDFYMGAMLRFNDEDIKALLFAAPLPAGGL